MAPPLHSEDLSAGLEAIRAKADLPALAAACFTADGIVEEQAAVGIRKRGVPGAATTADTWALGSDTKAMTATLAATFVEEGKLSWETPILSFFPECADAVPQALRQATVGQLLSHRAGLKEYNTLPELTELFTRGTVPQQRNAAARIALTHAPYLPGSYCYSNADYIVAGAILEKIGGKPWEELMRERLFKPLGMASADFGGEKAGHPWPHFGNGEPAPEDNPYATPAFIAPAGLVHCPMSDWVRFLSDQLRGAAGRYALLPPEFYRALQTPAPGADYAYGWGNVERKWAGGRALTHAGSDGMNYAVCWLAPARGFGLLVCTNQGGAAAAKACDDAIGLLIVRHEARIKK